MFVTMASLKQKGDLAELKIATDLVAQRYRILLPFGEDHDYDLVIDDGSAFQRVQVKYTTSAGDVVTVRCFSHSLTNGRVRVTKRYTADTIDWMAVWDATTDRCFYIPAAALGTGRSELRLRLTPCHNSQRRRIRWAEDYTDLATAAAAFERLDLAASGP
jgi:hypothetical protein